MLGGPTGGVPGVRGYALRSLRACVPEQVLGFPLLLMSLSTYQGPLPWSISISALGL